MIAHRIASGLLCVAALAATGCAREPEPAAESASTSASTVFEGARIITGTDQPPIENGAFIVEDGQIAWVGVSGDATIPPDAQRVDLQGKTVIPVLIDTHAHLSQTREALIEDLRRRAYYGVGVVVSLGQDEGDLAFQVREETVPNAARLRTAGRGITAPEPGRSEVPFWVTSEEEARKAVQELAAQQVDIVKIWVDDRGGQYMKLTPAIYGAVIDEAHQNGLIVTAHIFTLEDAKGLLRAGVDAFAHGIRDQEVDAEVIALFKERPNVTLVPNLPNRGVATDLSWLADSVPAGELQKLQAAATDNPEAQKTYALQAANLERLSNEGVRIGLGTDGNTPWAAHLEMADMVAAGMTPAEVIVAATRNSAALLEIQDLGTLEAGKSADFVVLDANPLDDITNTRRISAVYLRGAAIDREALNAPSSTSTAP